MSDPDVAHTSTKCTCELLLWYQGAGQSFERLSELKSIRKTVRKDLHQRRFIHWQLSCPCNCRDGMPRSTKARVNENMTTRNMLVGREATILVWDLWL